jgi:RNAse (barnase) inhibitor barstar
MKNRSDSFIFVPEIHAFESKEDAFLAWIPPDIAEKQRLLRTLAMQLQFPSYFGWNWDALYDLLCDFSWIPTRRIAIIHQDVPLRFERKEGKIYLKLLADAIDGWKTDEEHELLSVFPITCRELIQTLLQE